MRAGTMALRRGAPPCSLTRARHFLWIRDSRPPGIRLEIIGGIPLWETRPVSMHQKALDRIRESRSNRKAAACPCLRPKFANQLSL